MGADRGNEIGVLCGTRVEIKGTVTTTSGVSVGKAVARANAGVSDGVGVLVDSPPPGNAVAVTSAGLGVSEAVGV